jgi:hypothetical protein
MSETSKFSQYNRDVIRKAASQAGVSNVSYKSKAENIEAMKALGVTEIQVVNGQVFVDSPKTLGEQAQAKSLGAIADVIDEVAALSVEAVLDAEEGIPAAEFDTASPEYVDEVLDAENHAAVPNEDTWTEEFVGEFFDGRERERLAVEVGEPQAPVRNYHLSIAADGRSTVTFVSNGDLVSVDSEHDAYLRVLEALLAGQDPEPWLGDAVNVEAIVEALSDRLSVVFPASPDPDPKPVVLFDGEPIHGRLVDVFLRYHLEGRDASNLVKFLERCQVNPVEGAAQQLFDWDGAVNGRLAINEDGFFVGYKSLRRSSEPGKFEPSQRGPGEVNGVKPADGILRQGIGDVVTIDPKLVKPGPECSVGLHVGSWDYAAGFGGDVKCEVLVDPADVVNIPRSETGKMRVVRYTVAQFHERRDGIASHHEPPAVPLENLEVSLLDAEVPVGFWKRLLKRRGR